MKVIITGSHGLIGSALYERLGKNNYSLIRLVRNKDQQNTQDIFWSPSRGEIEAAKIENSDAIVHLAGENLFGFWTAEKKTKIYNSRIESTRLLAETLLSLTNPPRIFLSASAAGYYGDRGDEIITDEAPQGKGFLPVLCQDWEGAALPLEKHGFRVVFLRSGILITTKGGALKLMLKPFKAGLGGYVGDGGQFISWISLEDEIAAIQHILENDELQGPFNMATPNPVTNKEFAKTIGQVINRPVLFPVPAKALEMFLGDMADETLLTSIRMHPAKLLKS